MGRGKLARVFRPLFGLQPLLVEEFLELGPVDGAAAVRKSFDSGGDWFEAALVVAGDGAGLGFDHADVPFLAMLVKPSLDGLSPRGVVESPIGLSSISPST